MKEPKTVAVKRTLVSGRDLSKRKMVRVDEGAGIVVEVGARR